MNMLIELIVGSLILIAFFWVCVSFGRHSSSEEIKKTLGESLSLRSGRSISSYDD
jgi:preprotein translocase subunit SecY